MTPNKVKQLVSEPHELLFYPINSISSILRFCGILSCVFVITKQGLNDTLKRHLHFPKYKVKFIP